MAVRKPQLRLAVKKAKPAADWVALYSQDGRLIGICPPDAITPVSDGGGTATAMPKPKTAAAKTANQEPGMPKPTPSDEATSAAGEEPAMGTRPAKPKPAAGQPVTDAERQEEIAKLRKGLGGVGLAADHDRLAAEMGAAAGRVFAQIRRGRPTVR